MTLTGPTSAVANETVRVEGRLTLDGREPGRRVELALMRLATAPDGNRWTIMPDIQTAEDGSFSFTDEVPGVGSYRYFVVWNGDSGYASARAEHSIEVASRRAEWQVAPSIDGEVDRPYSVGGMLVFDSGPCSGPQVIHVRRQAGTESPERLPDVTTDDGCYFAFTDRHGSAGEVKYSLWWDGDAGHDGASAEVTARVDLAGTYFFFHTAAVTLPWSGGRASFEGQLQDESTGTLIPGAPVSVVRRDVQSGKTVQLPSLVTGEDGTFTIKDRLRRNVTKAERRYEYEVSYAGTPKWYGAAVGLISFVSGRSGPSR